MSDLAEVAGVLADVEEIDGVVVAGFVGEFVVEVGVLPGLGDLSNVNGCNQDGRGAKKKALTEP